MGVDTGRIYTLILGGGRGTGLFPLTKDRAKPAVPLAGKFRLIDVPISNCINSHLGKIFVVTQFNSQSLHRHIHNAYKFDIFSENFVEILAAEQTLGKCDWYQGTADAVRRNLWHLTDSDVDRVLVLSGDQLYHMDFRDLMVKHDENRAEMTLAATPRHPDDAVNTGVLKIDRHFRVVDFVENPSKSEMRDLIIQGEDLAPLGVMADGPVVLSSMGIYLFNRTRLELALDNAMTDFVKDVIPWSIKHMRVFMHPFVGYWQNVGSMRSYFEANIALTDASPQFDFYKNNKPIYTHPRFLPNNKILGASEIANAIISEGSIVDNAKIKRSVIGIRSVINSGSVLEEVIILGQDSYETMESREESAGLPARGVGVNCRITRAIIDKNARIGDNVVINSHLGKADEDGDCYYVRDGIVIIPKNAIVQEGMVI